MEEKLPLTSKAQPQLDEKYPGYNFMTITDVASGKEKLVGTTKSITLAPLYHEITLDGPEEMDIAAELIFVALTQKYQKNRLRKRGKELIVGYSTPEEYQDQIAAQKVERLNTLVKPKIGKSPGRDI